MKKLLLTLAVALSAPLLAFSQEGPAGQFLELSPDARALSVGGASLTMEPSSYAIWEGGAASAFSAKTLSVSATYGLWQPKGAGASVIAVAGYGKLSRKLSLNVGFKYMLEKGYDQTDINGSYLGSFTPKEFNVSAGVGYRFIPCLSAGLSLTYLRSDLGGPEVANGVGVDVSVLYKWRGLKASLQASNLGSKLNYGGSQKYSLPSKLMLGVGYTLGKEQAKNHVDFMAQGGMYFKGASGFGSVGVQYRLKEVFRLAAGYNYSSSDVLPSFASVGAGFCVAGVSFDLSYLIGSGDNLASNTLMFNIGYTF